MAKEDVSVLLAIADSLLFLADDYLEEKLLFIIGDSVNGIKRFVFLDLAILTIKLVFADSFDAIIVFPALIY